MNKKTKKPLFSIITPSFNQGNFIEQNLISVKNQGYQNIEHIVVDGGSDDQTVDILKKYQDEYNLKWISEKDRGQSHAINKGIEMAKGEIIGWLNSDDVCLFKNTLSNVVEYFKNKDNHIIFGNVALINKYNKILRIHNYQKFNYNKMLFSNNIAQPSVFFRREVLKKNKIREDLNYVMDYELWLRLGKKYNFKYINETFSGFRIYKEAKSRSQNKRKIDKEMAEIKETYTSNKNKTKGILKFKNKILKGINSRIGGFINLLKYKYVKKQKFAFNGNYYKFPFDLIYQLFKDMNKYYEK